MCCESSGVSPQKISLFTIGLLFCIIGTVIMIKIWLPDITEIIVHIKHQLSPSSWLNLPTSVYMFVYVFNWTNMFDVTNHNVTPNFVQLGPYVFREVKNKEDITWCNNDTLTLYHGHRTWFFENDMSIGSLDDLITLPQSPSMVVADQVRNWNSYMKQIMNYVLNTEGGHLVVNKPIGNWLFKGFYDPLAEFAMLLQSELIPWRFANFGISKKKHNDTYSVHTKICDDNCPEDTSPMAGDASPSDPAFSLRSCLVKAPLHLSSLNADTSHINTLGAMNSNPGIHGFHMDTELDALAKMQIGVHLNDENIIQILRNINEFYTPLAVISERGAFKEKLDGIVTFCL